MIKNHLLILIPVTLLLMGCATGSDIDTGGYFSTGMTLSSVDSVPVEDLFNLSDEHYDQLSVEKEMSIESNPISMHDGIMNPHRLY